MSGQSIIGISNIEEFRLNKNQKQNLINQSDYQICSGKKIIGLIFLDPDYEIEQKRKLPKCILKEIVYNSNNGCSETHIYGDFK